MEVRLDFVVVVPKKVVYRKEKKKFGLMHKMSTRWCTVRRPSHST